jgi:hypothetical protein
MKEKLAFADDHFHDECGVFGVFGHPDAARNQRGLWPVRAAT